MPKRPLSPAIPSPNKRVHSLRPFPRISSPQTAAAVDANPPLSQLLHALRFSAKDDRPGQSVVYWMRMADLRIHDNRALSRASEHAHKKGVPLIVLFVLSPQDYKAHDRSSRRIDFTLRNLAILQRKLSDDFHIPLHIATHQVRKTLPSFVISFLEKYGSGALYANIEYEIDELRRDIEICNLAKEKNMPVNLLHNKCIVEPGVLFTKQNKPYSVYSPYQRNWIVKLNGSLSHYLEDCPKPRANDEKIKSSTKFSSLFDSVVPSHVEGFKLEAADAERMAQVWPAGENAAFEVLRRFLHCRSDPSRLGPSDPILEDASKDDDKHSRIVKYGQERDRADRDSTSRLSPYLSAGVISIRECVRATMRLSNAKKVETDKNSGIGRWIQELAWRDFYTDILSSFPRVSMGRPYLEKLSTVVWENHQAPHDAGQGDEQSFSDTEALARWKEGKTGVPIVDATMRAIREMGWVHNRARMISAMYLTKDLMIDWRVGERYFMQNLIDGDLASNNGGWQWSASTGVDPCPYFRIFNPTSQSQKADPTGQFIRHWVPELGKVAGPDLHDPPASVAKKVGYPLPIIAHKDARERALRRFKNPGEK